MSGAREYYEVFACETVPLGSAMLCQNCEIISAAPDLRCPACGSQSLLALARILNRDIRQEVKHAVL